MIPASFFDRSAVAVAQGLIGARFLVGGVGGIVTETEAYDEGDPASHSHGGRRTPRNAAMFGPPGRAYVYRSYGLHWCFNVVCEREGLGSAVLVRALQPTEGIAAMAARRGTDDPRRLCSGPGRLTQALGIDAGLDGRALDAPPFRLDLPAAPAVLLAGRRIGITRGVETPWRFGLAGSAHLSRRFPDAP